MIKRIPLIFLGLVVWVGAGCGSELYAQSVNDSKLSDAEARLRAIYERREFRARRPRPEWQSDSAGYTVRERRPSDNRQELVRYDVASGERSVLDKYQDIKKWTGIYSPDGSHTAMNRRGKLVVRNLETGEEVVHTERSDERSVSIREISWSPDGKWIAFVEADDTNVKLRSMLVPSDPSYPGVREVRFARVGETITRLRVGVADASGEQQVNWIDIDAPEEGIYLGQVEWAGNSDELLIEKLSRFRDEREFLLADLRSGSTRRIFHEQNEAWAISSQGKNSGLEWIRDGEAFVVISEKDGWRHAFLCSRDGEELSLLTPGEYDIIERSIIDEQGGWFYFYASPENATQQFLHRVPLDGSGQREQITPDDQPGWHDYDFSPDASWAFHTHSAFDSPPLVELVKMPEHQSVRVLEDNSELRERLAKVISRPTEFFQIETEDGISMDAWMIKPQEFDDTKKYPVLVYVYGEPHGQTVLDRWGTSHDGYHRMIADLGYLVVSIDNRGTPAPKGAAWRRSIFPSLGPLSTDDQAAALRQLAVDRSYVDLSRVAIWGWSGGGSNTLNAMFRQPDLYEVGIAVVPKPQPHLYNAWFQEIYMRTREVNAEGYERSAPINFADGLKGDLLIISGSGETNTHLQIVEGLVDRLIELGKPFDYMVYPNRNHGLSEGKGTAVHLRMLMARYLTDHVTPGPQ